LQRTTITCKFTSNRYLPLWKIHRRHAPRPELVTPYFLVISAIEPRENHDLLLHIWRTLADCPFPCTARASRQSRLGNRINDARTRAYPRASRQISPRFRSFACAFEGIDKRCNRASNAKLRRGIRPANRRSLVASRHGHLLGHSGFSRGKPRQGQVPKAHRRIGLARLYRRDGKSRFHPAIDVHRTRQGICCSNLASLLSQCRFIPLLAGQREIATVAWRTRACPGLVAVRFVRGPAPPSLLWLLRQRPIVGPAPHLAPSGAPPEGQKYRHERFASIATNRTIHLHRADRRGPPSVLRHPAVPVVLEPLVDPADQADPEFLCLAVEPANWRHVRWQEETRGTLANSTR
jgi:hypothetical protein